MNIYFLRHGEAHREAASDDQRELTDLGRSETAKVMHWLKAKDPQIDVIVASPYVRACQTAEIVQDVLNIDNAILITQNITPENSSEDIVPVLQSLHDRNILIVTHMPFIKEVITGLLKKENRTELSIPTSTLALVRLDKVEFGSGSLEFMVNPSQLDKSK